MAPIILQPSSSQVQDASPVSKIDLSAQTQLFSWQSCVSSIKESLVTQLAYLAHDVNAFLDTSDSGAFECDSATFHDPKKLVVSTGDDKRALNNPAVVVPFYATVPQEPEFTAAALAPNMGMHSTHDEGRASGHEMSEHCAATTIQRMIRKRAATPTTDSPCSAPADQELQQATVQEDSESTGVFTSFSRVSHALRRFFSSESTADDSQDQAARQIQRVWRRYESRSKTLETSLAAPATLASSESSAPPSLSKRKRTRECATESEPEQDTTSESHEDDELAELATRNESNDCEPEYVFVAKRCVSVPPPSTAIRPIALKSRLLVVHSKAACVIQSAWRCVLARLHLVTLRRQSAYELACENVMPEVRSQMKLVQQRPNKLQERSSSSDKEETAFDDDWL